MKYRIKYVYEKWYDLEIEAQDEERAWQVFYAGEFAGEPRLVGGELQADPILEEVKG